jgi:hypothetical protein
LYVGYPLPLTLASEEILTLEELLSYVNLMWLTSDTFVKSMVVATTRFSFWASDQDLNLSQTVCEDLTPQQ